MDIIYTDVNGTELGYLVRTSVDINIGDTNDFEIAVGIKNGLLDYGDRFFVEDTEYGGIVKRRTVNTKTNKISYGGYTWRGILSKKIVCPLSGQNYYTVSGNFSSVCKSLISYTDLDKLFLYDDATRDIAIGMYQFERYDTLLNGFVKMLAKVNCRLKLRYKERYVYVSAEPIRDYSDEIELSSDGNVKVKIEDDRDFVNHLICLGKGELADRTVIHLFLQKNGTIGTLQFYSGTDEITDVYDYPNAENEDDLILKGKEKFLSLITQKKMDVNVEGIDVELGEIIGGREYITGTVIKKPITDKIITIDENGSTKISYKVGD